MKSIIRSVLIVLVLGALGGCVYPYDGYYAPTGYYNQSYYPAYTPVYYHTYPTYYWRNHHRYHHRYYR